MNREEALKLLEGGAEGIAEWNRRLKKGEDIPDLRGADLGGATLSGAHLSLANLSEADLSEANLAEAYLYKADLHGADLHGAYLSGVDLGAANLKRANLLLADLSYARLTHSKLEQANLAGARLEYAKLTGTKLNGASLRNAVFNVADLRLADLTDADLQEADFQGAHLSGATFVGAKWAGARLGRNDIANVDLTAAQGLDSVIYLGPSSIGLDTVLRSKGSIPGIFLEGCGLPDALIENLPALIGASLPYTSCFITSVNEDAVFCERLYSQMRAEHLRVWPTRGCGAGAAHLGPINPACYGTYDKRLLVLSEHSMASEWLGLEIEGARGQERREGRRVLFPIRLVDMEPIKDWKCSCCDPEDDLAGYVREHEIADFSNWKDHDAFEKAFARLLRDLKAAAEPACGEPAAT